MTNRYLRGIIIKRLRKAQKCGGVAQLARATGSYPVGHGFKSNSRYHRPVGQAAKTPPFHGGNRSSILLRVTKRNKSELLIVRICFFTIIIRINVNRIPPRATGYGHSRRLIYKLFCQFISQEFHNIVQ